MSTRSLTSVIEKYNHEGKSRKQVLMTMYRQSDGYLEGMGSDLAEFLDGSKVVNGIGVGETNEKPVFNGAGCLAAQLVAHFKQGAGGYYIVKAGSINHGEEYRYEIIVNEDDKTVTLKAFEVGYMKGDKYINKTRKLFEGSPHEFLTVFLKQNQEANV